MSAEQSLFSRYNYQSISFSNARERILHNLAHLFVIGGASLDTLHFKGQTVRSAGGAGMYTTMAAIRCGAKASMFAPRPEPMPAELDPVAKKLDQWLGPVIPAERLPHFEIQHSGDKATYLVASIGAEGELTTEQLPGDLSVFDCVHLTPLGNSKLQQEFVIACRAKGARLISSGTYLCTIKDQPELIRRTIELCDLFFMNEEEAGLLFGSLDQVRTSAGNLMFVTLGAKGVIVVQGDEQTRLPATGARVLDPTGAGDTFCGATLAGLMQGLHPVMSALRAVSLAAEEIESVGPAALLLDKPAPKTLPDERVRLDHEQIERISKIVSVAEAAKASDFTGKDFPPAGHPKTLDYFFATILQQFSFWETIEDHYDHPLVATIDGDLLKGSAYLFRAFRLPLDNDPDFYSPQRQAALTRDEMLKLFRADDGSDPMPAFDLHLEMAKRYGREMIATGKTPQQIVERAKKSETPLKTFIGELDQIGGYKEDPLRKKSNLLALVLNQRPEKFLSFAEGEEVPPVIDYHTMRGCLRMGLVEILDESLKEKIQRRQIVNADEEWAIRYACYLAVEDVVRISGKSLGAVDWFFFAYSRQRCPEMSEPECAKCAVDDVCLHRKDLFQPVLRTTYY